MLLTALVFFLILSVLILIHELGHFIAAKKLGIRVDEFGFGLPPRIFGIRRGETTYSINWLPIGGFVKLFGEEGESEIKEYPKSQIRNPKFQKDIKHRAFYTRPIKHRVLVLVAGVTMNFLLAFVIITYLFTRGVKVPTNRIHIEKVKTGAPAETAGLREKDVIEKIRFINEKLKFEETDIKTGEKLIETTKKHVGERITLIISRNGNKLEIGVVPRKEYPKDEGPMGIVISNYEEKKYPFYQAPFLGMKESVVMSFELVKGIGKTLWKLVSFQPVSKDVAGPIGIAQMTGLAVKSGTSAVLELLGLLSLNLAIVNILPFPALDGGRLLFVLIEGSTGKKIKTKWERYIHQAGMIILLFLMVLVTLNDLVRVFSK